MIKAYLKTVSGGQYCEIETELDYLADGPNDVAFYRVVAVYEDGVRVNLTREIEREAELAVFETEREDL